MSETKLSADNLVEEIERLESLRRDQEKHIKATVKKTTDSLKPVNLIKNMFSSAKSNVKQGVISGATNPKAQQALITTALSFGAGILAKRLLVGKTKKAGIVKSFVGNSLETAVASLVARYGIYAQAWVTAFIKEFFSKNNRVKDVTY